VEEKRRKNMDKQASPVSAPTAVSTLPAAPVQTFKIEVPELKEFLKAGVQFGHETRKWNPKMKKYIFGSKKKIHIIDLAQTVEATKKAAEFLAQAASKGPVMFVATKRQAAEIVKNAAVDCGAYFITQRWPGGLLTNFKNIQKSLRVYNQLEEDFEKGITNRTKFEVAMLKKEWENMNRQYEGVKKMDRYPTAVVIIDCNYERGALREARKLKLPVIAMVDTNSDPTNVDYPIPANDDAIRSIGLLMDILSKAVKMGNKGAGVKHEFKNFSNYEVQIVKKIVEEEAGAVEEISAQGVAAEPAIARQIKIPESPKPTNKDKKGILEKIKDESELEKNTVKVKPVKVAVKEPAKAKKGLPKVVKSVKTTKKAATKPTPKKKAAKK
jgi:small subunit ribosomal protein S2